MSRRFRQNALAREEMVSLKAAREAIGKVAAERDAVVQQLNRAQATLTSLQRQLDARRAESAHLEQTIRALEARTQAPVAVAPQISERKLRSLQDRITQLEEWVRQLELERDEAIAERDRERAEKKRTQAALAELQDVDPDRERAMRLTADLANMRRNQAQVIQQRVRSETQRLLIEIGSIRDTVERALASGPPVGGPWHDGLLAIRSRVDTVLKREGVTLIGEVGEHFDPKLHEAIGTAPGDSPDTVQEVVSSGLMLDDGSVIVPARVLVSA